MASRASGRTRLVDVGKAVGVSATVVSAVLRGAGGNVRVSAAVADRVRAAARKLNYRPSFAAQQLKGRPSDVIAVLIGAESTPANYQRLAALEEAAFAVGYRLMIGQFRENPDRTDAYVQDFLDRGISDLICFHNPAPRFELPTIDWLRQFRRVVFQTHAAFDGAYCVDVNRAAGVKEAVEYLASQGRRRIGLVLNSPDDPLMLDRLAGYREGLKTVGQNMELVWAGPGKFPPGDETIGAACEAMLNRDHADAIVASNDYWAIYLLKALRKRGVRVPDDVALIGFDNLDAAALADPALTTLDQNNTDFAAAMMKIVLADDMEIPERLVVKPRLVIRESA